MKFDCDVFNRWRILRKIAKLNRHLEWKRRFAFFPVKLSKNDCRWLEPYYERATRVHYGSYSTTVQDSATLFDLADYLVRDSYSGDYYLDLETISKEEAASRGIRV